MTTLQIPFSDLESVATVSWRDVQSLEAAKSTIDAGYILSLRDAKRMHRTLSEQDAAAFMKHLAARLCEPNEERLQDEIFVESVLAFLTSAPDERSMIAFLEELFDQPRRSETAFRLVEVALNIELSEAGHDQEYFATAVSLVCELGSAVRALDQNNPGSIDKAQDLISHVATYLLSVSNSNNTRVRLSLLNYFGAAEFGMENKPGFSKIMNRFGHTVLDTLFQFLFHKKTEGVALQYMLENMPYMLEGDHHTQKIIHETFKFYMLKNPERFGLFLSTLARELKSSEERRSSYTLKVYFQHVGALLRIVSELNHRALTQTIISCLGMFDGFHERREVIDQILAIPDLRRNVKEYLVAMRDTADSKKVVDSASRFVDTKRGRKPSFSKVDAMLVLNQVAFLSSEELPTGT